MGYYTIYELSVADKSGKEITANEKLEEIANFFTDSPNIDRDSFLEVLTSGLSAKWYEHETDMISLSTHFPHLVFTLDSSGEDGQDWRYYYHNGSAQEAKMTYTPCKFFEEINKVKL